MISQSGFFTKLNSSSETVPIEDTGLNSLDIDYFQKNNINDYIIGPGDQLKITAAIEYPELKAEVLIDVNGSITLAKLKNIFVEGLTIKELTALLEKAYKKYIKYPTDLEVQLRGYRPIKAFVKGEVQRPGVQVMDGSIVDGSVELTETEDIQNSESIYFPTVFDALRQAGGITPYSDLSSIELLRANPISKGGGYKMATLNLEQTLLAGNLSQNIRIYDGDIIKVKRSATPNEEILSKAIGSRINKRLIKVYISGRVKTKGYLEIASASTLTDAINIAGGLKAIRGNVNFVRFENNGTITRRSFRYNKKAKAGSYKNPALANGDIIYVGDSILSTTGEVIGEFTEPFANAFSAYGLYKAITD